MIELALLQDVLQEPELIDWEWLKENFWEDIVPAVQGHIFLSVISVAVALVIALPVGILSARYRKIYPPVTFVTGILYSIPSLALFAILISIPGVAIGPTPVIIALVAYSLLILFRNMMEGFANVPAETRDAGRGMGLTQQQLLWRVELPLALPEIMAGLRIALTTTVGLASLAFLAGAGGLGEALFDQIAFRSNVLVAGGLALLLAVALDLLVLGVQKAITPWTRAVST